VLPASAQRTVLPWSGNGPRPKPRYRDKPDSVAAAVAAAGRPARRRVVWRTGWKGPLSSYFVALRVRRAGVRIRRAHAGEDLPECSLLAEWPARALEPTKFWLSTLPADIPLRRLVRSAKVRWRIEHDYPELKQALAWPTSKAAPGPAGTTTSCWSPSPTPSSPASV